MSSGRQRVCARIVIVLVAVLLWFPLCAWLRARDWRAHSYRAYGYGRWATMRQISTGLLMYSGDHNGHFPPELWTLHDGDYLADARMLTGPGRLEPGNNIWEQYHYYGAGLKDDAADPTTTLLLLYPYRSFDGTRLNVTALFVDGRVEVFDDCRLHEIARMLVTGRALTEDFQ